MSHQDDNIFADEHEESGHNEFIDEMNNEQELFQTHSQDRSKSNNPFLDPDYIQKDTSQGDLDSMNDDDQSSFQNSQKKHTDDNQGYRGYFNNGKSTALGDVKNSNVSLNDRFNPQSLKNGNNYQNNSSSSVNSSDEFLKPQNMDILVQKGSTLKMRDLSVATGLNEVLNNPTVGDEDFSPFGGYPASSFPLLMEEKEDDDYLHNPDPEEEARLDRNRFSLDFKNMDRKSFGGWSAVVVLFLGIIAVFVVLPVLTYSNVIDYHASTDVIELLSPYRYPQLSAIRTSLVDPDTPSDALTKKSTGGDTWQLVFSDEFNANGRTFYSGDDQFWEAPDIHYAATQDLEWYDPDASIVANGSLTLTLDAFENHNLFYRSGMVQSWNKLCFSQGRIEISANLPNYGEVTGLWPGLWTMGNLGRPGFLASTEGTWPYSYEACDAGITPNQSSTDGISYLAGQKLNSCTCKGESHPNQGTGRGAPEIDILEAETDTYLGPGVGLASQSFQVAPFDIWYMPDYTFVEVYNFSTTTMNTYCGGPYQQAISAVTTLNNNWYQFGPGSGQFQVYGYEYLSDDKEGYITWLVGDEPTWTMHSYALHPNGNIDWRYVPKEPMSIIMNLGISNSWAYINWQSIFFPVTMSIDHVRIYQPADAQSITCDPEDYPTYDYIQAHKIAYENNNMTSWADCGYSWPKNSLMNGCSV